MAVDQEKALHEVVRFILENAQLTTTGNYAVFGTITPEVLAEMKALHPRGVRIFDNATKERIRGKKKA